MTSSSERLQLMHVSRQLLRAEIQDLEVRYNLDPISPLVEQTTEEEGYYLQFSAATRRQAQEMSQYYRVFYCLENSIRDLVESQMEATHGENWWDHHVPDNIKAGVRGNKQREQDNGVTLRSAHPIDYTTFGELSEIIKNNWVEDQATASARVRVINFMGEVAQGKKTMKDVASESGNSLRTAKGITRNTANVPAPFTSEALSSLFATPNGKPVLVNTADGFALAHINTIRWPENVNENSEEFKKFKATIAVETQQEAMGVFLEDKTREYRAVVNNGLLQRAYSAPQDGSQQ